MLLYTACPNHVMGNYTSLMLVSGISIQSGHRRVDLSANYQTLLDTGQLFKSHAKFKNVHDVRTQLGLKDCILRHVLAHGLQSLIAPTSLKAHQKLSSNYSDIGMLLTMRSTMVLSLYLLGK
jgi:hypothetical protein